MMVRPARQRPWIVIVSITILALALLSGAFFFLLPKLAAASTTQTTSMGATNNTAQTLNTTKNTGAANMTNKPGTTSSTNTANTTNTANASGNANNAGQQVAPQTNQPAPATTTQSSNVPTTGNNNSPQQTTTQSGNNAGQQQATSQNLSVPLVMLKQYVPDIRHIVAQKFNITDKALALQLQNGIHLTDIAMQHGFSVTQLENLLSSAITLGFQPAVATGLLTQTQISTFIQQIQINPTTLEQQLSILPPPVAHW